ERGGGVGSGAGALGPGGPHGREKGRSLCPSPCVPSPSTKRPPETFCRSHAVCAMIIGLRGKAPAIAVPSWTRVVLAAATASGRKGSCFVSADQSAPTPSSSARRAQAGHPRGGCVGHARSHLAITPSSVLVGREPHIHLRA